jgi:hypothetical protein
LGAFSSTGKDKLDRKSDGTCSVERIPLKMFVWKKCMTEAGITLKEIVSSMEIRKKRQSYNSS